MAVEDSKATLRLTLPSRPNRATTDVYCPAGDISCKAREWTSAATATELTASCFACDTSGGSCTSTQSAASPGMGVV